MPGPVDQITKASDLEFAPIIKPVPRSQALPLSFAQEQLWFLDQLNPGSAVYNLPMALHLEGPIDAGLLRKCLVEAIERHEALRTCFKLVNGNPTQVIEDVVTFAMPETDLSQLPDVEREAEARRLCMEEAREPFDLSKAPMLRARLIRLHPASNVLLLNLHHIASDGWSLEVLLRELDIL